MLTRTHVDVIDRSGPVTEVPLVEIAAVLIEDLDAAITPVVDVDS